MAKKNRWNPSSKVNCNHVTGMLAKGTAEYKDWVGRAFSVPADADAEYFEDIIREGHEDGYLTDENVDTLLGTGPSTKDVQAAAAGNAQAQMISGLANAGQHSAVASMIGTTVSQDQVDQVYEALNLDFATLTAPEA